MSTPFMQRKFSPIVQAGIVFGGAVLFMAFGWLLTVTGFYPVERLFAWSIGAAFLLFFAMFNSLLSLRADNFAKYWAASMYSFLALALSTSGAAWMFSGVPIGEAESYRWIYIVVTFGFLVFLSLDNFMKIIVRFAEREEWNAPRTRNRKRK
ncbi:MAG: hypothetical protein ABIQ93_09095 [Saprospiraceae bacterium]